ncbi:MAG TPA: hypothetical protein VL283_02110 [Candidatus Baltobacteraceae bacterium]|jgi:hypothetical protein|nr:hypothetical protein [Candidatus Baltobacteraceae bacterium]
MAKLKVEIEVVPNSGKTVTKTVSVDKTGASIRSVLEAAGVDASKNDIRVGGKPVTDLDMHIAEAADGKARMVITERPQGS